jgi:phosphotransferase system enzyme I (PtsP)
MFTISGAAVSQERTADTGATRRRGVRGQTIVSGVPASPGVAIGVLFAPAAQCPLEAVPDQQADDPQAELGRLETALDVLRGELSDRSGAGAPSVPAEMRSLYRVYELLLDDVTLREELSRRVLDGLWAPAALRDTVNSLAAHFESMESAYLTARAEDIRGLGRRLLRLLMDCGEGKRALPERTLLMGEGLGIACITAVPVERLAGLVCTSGSPLSHGVIIARALGIPAVVGAEGLRLVESNGNRPAIVDGYRGRVILDPNPEVLAEYQRFAQAERGRAANLGADRDLPARTTDGRTLTLQANIALLAEIPTAREVGAEGVGLYRSEIPFLIQDALLPEDTQAALCRELLEAFAPHPVTVRTLDVGSDKPLSSLHPVEPNPALGQRGIRLLLAHPEIFLTQLRALLRANAGIGNLRLMLPMVTLPEEIRATRRLLDQARRELVPTLAAVVTPPLGVMVEVPAAVLRIDALAGLADFVSIGTNDLAQYVLAADRSNPRLEGLCDPLSPAVLSALALAVEGAHRRGVPVGVCGEMAGDPLGALLLLGLGVDSLSLAATGIPEVRQLVRRWSQRAAHRLWEQALRLETAQEVRALVRAAIEGQPRA